MSELVTAVRTHTYVTFANPHLVCAVCRRSVPQYHCGDRCGCEVGSWNQPCQHTAGIVNLCSTWGPADGCTCEDPTSHRRAFR